MGAHTHGIWSVLPGLSSPFETDGFQHTVKYSGPKEIADQKGFTNGERKLRQLMYENFRCRFACNFNGRIGSRGGRGIGCGLSEAILSAIMVLNSSDDCGCTKVKLNKECIGSARIF